MSFDVIMPQMGESIAEATILKWHKKVGDLVEKDETLYEISTDKVDAEIPSPSAGIITEILVDINKTVAVGTVVARIGSQGAQPQPAAASMPSADNTSNLNHSLPPRNSRNKAEESLETRLKTKSSPLVREIAKQHNIDITHIDGTGENGRVTKSDIEKVVKEKNRSLGSPGLLVPMPIMGPRHDPSAPTLGAVPGLSIPPTPHVPAFTPEERVKIEPMSRMRKIIADNMVNSKLKTSPHVYTIFEIDMTNVSHLRIRHRKKFEDTYDTKMSYMPFIMKAVIKALQSFPVLNSSVDGENIIYKQDINLGVAVSLDWGLIVPVIKNADSLNLGGLARSLNDLADRARSKKLSPDEVSGGTFTITNPGVFGDVFALPIINQPQVAIQAIGSIVKRPMVLTDESGNDSIAIRQMMFSGLSFDHRVVDGAVADQFMGIIKKELETDTFGLE